MGGSQDTLAYYMPTYTKKFLLPLEHTPNIEFSMLIPDFTLAGDQSVNLIWEQGKPKDQEYKQFPSIALKLGAYLILSPISAVSW